jgi:hypothetical protein
MRTNFDDIIREVLGMQKPTPEIQLAGDVLPFAGGRPSVNTLPSPSELYLPLWSNDGWPGSQWEPRSNTQKLNSIIKMPAND